MRNMVLRQKPDGYLVGFAGKRALSRPDFFHGLFWAVFLLAVVFMLALVGGLFIYGQWAVFLDVLKNEEFRFAVVFTLWTTLLATGFAVLFAIPCGFILSRHSFPAKALIETLLDVPIVLPPLVSGIALLILFGPLLGDKLARIGLDIVFSSRGVVIAELFVALPSPSGASNRLSTRWIPAWKISPARWAVLQYKCFFALPCPW